MIRVKLLTLFSLLAFQAMAQMGSIEGSVMDSISHEPLPFANVFLNNSTIGTTSDAQGYFVIHNVKLGGNYELVVSFVGYEAAKLNVKVTGQRLNIGTILLTPSKIELSTIEVKGTRDKEWEKQLKKFKKIFLGEDKQAAASKIENPWVLDFQQLKDGNTFAATANAPLEIVNSALGYRIFFYLTQFESNRKGYLIKGNAWFDEIVDANEQQQSLWAANRQLAYWHSSHHLFKAMVDHRIKGEGFYLYTDAPGYENNTVRSPYFFSELGEAVTAYDTASIVGYDAPTGLYRIALKSRLEVHYHKERAPVRTYRDVAYPVSWIELKHDSIWVDRNGYATEPAEVVVSGAMGNDRVARMLPVNYQPNGVDELEPIDLSWFREDIYVHTDKPYYYPGEPLWFKGYVNYATPAWQDSLSQTVYTELINPQKEIIASKTLRIDSGFFHNDFILPDTLKKGMYYIRAYTNLNRNFGDSTLYVKSIPVLGLTDKVDADKQNLVWNKNDNVVIASNKQAYQPREKIELSIQLRDDEGEPLSGNFSVSVTDAKQVFPLHTSSTIIDAFQPKEHKKLTYSGFLEYPIEYGVSLSGKYLNDEGAPEKALLNVVQIKPRDFRITQSNDQGIFKVDNLNFYDSAKFSIQANDSKNKPLGTVQLLPRETPAIAVRPTGTMPDITKTESPQRIISTYEVPKDTRVLKEVVITDTKIDETRQFRSYGKPDYVMKAKDINTSYANLLYAIQGKFPGLIVREAVNEKAEKIGAETRWVIYSTRFPSLGLPKEVLVTINDVAVGGAQPASILAAIDPQTVKSIEYTARINVLYGEQGSGGVLSIYTQANPSIDDKKEADKAPDLKLLTAPGYSSTRYFKSIDYSDPKTDASLADFRSTIYWNPDVTTKAETGKVTLSFYAADLEATYRVVVEGVTADHRPLHAEYLIPINR